MPNLQNNKVQLANGTTVIDITDTTATPSDVAAGEVFYKADGSRGVGTGNYMDKVANPTANDVLVTDANGQAVDSGVPLSAKQDTLVSGTNIKTINGQPILGSGDVETAYIAVYGTTTYTNLLTALSADNKAVIVKDIPYSTEYEDYNITILVNFWELYEGMGYNEIKIEGIITVDGDSYDVNIKVRSDNNSWTVTFTNTDSFMLLDFDQTIKVTIPYCTENVANTSIPNIDIGITDEMAVNWAVASLAKYEVKDANGARINCWPVCQFSMNGQKTLRLRMMCAGTTRKTTATITGAVLLKRR